MKVSRKNLKSIVARLRVMVDRGRLESRQMEAATKAIKDLARALNARDLRRIRAAIGRLARVFLSSEEL
ncbi:MAG: hypothetical protein ACREIH_04240 [Nitrospiraceae bacterium]